MRDDILIEAPDDGLFHDEVGAWSEDKYRLVSIYETIFSTGMKHQWDSRVYIDLYAGSGIVRLRGTNRFLMGSPLLALSVKNPFDRYIFCEQNHTALGALQQRVKKLFPTADVRFVAGDCGDNVEEVCQNIPRASQSYRVLSLCFVDPYDISVKFATLRRIADFYVDFVVLLALHMDANRNLSNYLTSSNRKVDDFLGNREWRKKWAEYKNKSDFPRFLAEEYAAQMQTLGFLPMPFHKMRQVRHGEKNIRLYELALFSHHPRAHEYWDEGLKYSTVQRTLF